MSMFLDQMNAMMLRYLIMCKFAFQLFACVQHFSIVLLNSMVTIRNGKEVIPGDPKKLHELDHSWLLAINSYCQMLSITV